MTNVSPTNDRGLQLERWFARLTDIDFTAPYAFGILAIVYVASRIPWLDKGYGADPDAWRVALSAKHLVTDGEYLPSRLPGFPLHELITSLMIDYGWYWTNLSTVLISLVGVYLFARIMRELALPQAGLLTIAFAFTPILWINSVSTIDYMWALTFLLGAYLALMRRWTMAAGIALAIAAGFRLTSLAMLVPLVVLLWRTDRRQEISLLVRTTVALTLVSYTPVMIIYGLKFLNFYEESISLEVVIRAVGKDGLGVLGALAVLAALAFSFRRLRRLPDDLTHDAHLVTWGATVAVFVFVYTWAPHEVAFLIPIVPFGLLLLSRYLNRALLAAAVAVIVLSGFVDLTASDESPEIRLSTLSGIRIGQGMLLSDLDTRQEQRDLVVDLRGFTAIGTALGPDAVVITGALYPELAALLDSQLAFDIIDKDFDALSIVSDMSRAVDRERGIEYVWLLDFEHFQEFRGQGKNIYITSDAARRTFALFGYRPAYFGAQLLPVEAQGVSPLGEGAVPTHR